MKSHFFALLAILTCRAFAADPPPEMLPQPVPVFTRAPAGAWNYGWQGVPGRTYLVEFADDMGVWRNLPITEAGAGAKSYGFTLSTSKGFVRLACSDEIPDLGKGGDWSPPLLGVDSQWTVRATDGSGTAAANVRLSFFRWPANSPTPFTAALMTATTAADGTYVFNPALLNPTDRVEIRLTGSPNQRVYLPWRQGSETADPDICPGGAGLAVADIVPAPGTAGEPSYVFVPPFIGQGGEVFRLMDFLTLDCYTHFGDIYPDIPIARYHPVAEPVVTNGNPELDENGVQKILRKGVTGFPPAESSEPTKPSTMLRNREFSLLDEVIVSGWMMSASDNRIKVSADFGIPGAISLKGSIIKERRVPGGSDQLPLVVEGQLPAPISIGAGVAPAVVCSSLPTEWAYTRHLVLGPVPAHVPREVIIGQSFHYLNGHDVTYHAELPLFAGALGVSRVRVGEVDVGSAPTRLRWHVTVLNASASAVPLAFKLYSRADVAYENGVLSADSNVADMIRLEFLNDTSSQLPGTFTLKFTCEIGLPQAVPAANDADYAWTPLGDFTQDFDRATIFPSVLATTQAAQLRGSNSTPESAGFNGGQRARTLEPERRIGVTGLPAPDAPTFVDALTGRFHHTETDFALPIPGSDLALTASRSAIDTIWTDAYGLRPAEDPLAAFGPGWDTNLSAALLRTRALNPDGTEIANAAAPPATPVPPHLIATLTLRDHLGSSYTFLETTGAGGTATYLPDPTLLPERATAGITLTKDIAGNYIFNQPALGITHTYQPTAANFSSTNNRHTANVGTTNPSGFTAREYFRLTSVTDRFGVTLNYTYGGLPGNLIPATIAVDGRPQLQLRIQQLNGRIQAVWDPAGVKHSYIYQNPGSATAGNSVLTSHQTGSLTAATYGYHLATEADPRPAAMRLKLAADPAATYAIPTYHLAPKTIANGTGNTLTIHYQPSQVRQAWSTAARAYYYPAGDPLLVESITLPNHIAVTFALDHTLKPGHSALPAVGSLPATAAEAADLSILTTVTDFHGHAWTYTFGVPTEQRWATPVAAQLPTAAALVFPSLTRACGAVVNSAVTFTYDPAAGYAPIRTEDAAGRHTTATYQESWPRPASPYTRPQVTATAALHDHYSQPTTTTDTLGHTTTYHYLQNPGHPDHLLPDTITDHRARVIAIPRDALARTTAITLRASATGDLLSQTDLAYNSAALPGLVTATTRKALNLAIDPAWITDLTTTIEPDANGFPRRTGHDANANGILSDAGDLATTTHRSPAGRILTTTAPNGGITSHLYDSAGLLECTWLPDGATQTYQRDPAGRLVLTRDPLGHATGIAYDSLGRPTIAVRDLNGDLTYNSATGALTGIDPATDITGAAEYLDATGIIRLTDPRGYITVQTLDPLGRPTEIISPSNTTEPGVIPTAATDYLTQLAYDPLQSPSSPVEITDPLGYETVFKFDAFARLKQTLRRYAPGAYSGTSYGFDEATGLPSTLTATRTPLDDEGAPISGTAQNLVTQLTHDLLDQPETTTRALGTTSEVLTITARTSTGIPFRTATRTALATATAPEKWAITAIKCDPLGRTTRQILPTTIDATTDEPGNLSTTYIYNAAGQLEETRDAYGHPTSYGYDIAGRLAWKKLPPVTDARSGLTAQRPTTIYRYDARGQLVRRVDPLGYAWAYEHDPAGRLLKTTGPVVRPEAADPARRQPIWQNQYDPASNPTHTTDPEGHLTTHTYYPNNTLATTTTPVHLTDAAGTTTLVDVTHRFQRDPAGRLTRLTDGANQATAFTYDGLGRTLTTTRDPADARAKTDTTEYDALLPTAFTDAKDQRRETLYTDAFLPESLNFISTPDASLTYQYDLLGRLTDIRPTAARLATTATQGDPTIHRAYDALGLLASETSNTVTTQYGYDLLGQLSKLTTPTRTQTIQHDPAGRATRIIDVAGSTQKTVYGHDLAGRPVTQDMPNGLQQASAYDPIGRLLKQTLATGQGQELTTTKYQYDLLANVTRIDEETQLSGGSPRIIENTYDERSQLTGEVQTNPLTATVATATTHRYDAAENRIYSAIVTPAATLTRVFDYGTPTNGLNSNQLHQLVETSSNAPPATTTYTYDDNGNRETKTTGTVQDLYHYDSFNRLAQLTLATAGPENGTYNYAYDPFTRRIARSAGTSPTAATLHQFAFSGQSPIQEWDGPTAPTNPPTNPLTEHLGGGVGGRLLTQEANGQFTYPLYNHRGDLTAQFTTAGTPTWHGTYTAEGLLQAQAGTKSGSYGTNGKWEEPAGLINDGFRYRDRFTNTFLQPDPMGFIDGPNRYNYVGHNPWSAWDPNGLAATLPYTTGDIGYVSPSTTTDPNAGLPNPPENGGPQPPSGVLKMPDSSTSQTTIDPVSGLLDQSNLVKMYLHFAELLEHYRAPMSVWISPDGVLSIAPIWRNADGSVDWVLWTGEMAGLTFRHIWNTYPTRFIEHVTDPQFVMSNFVGGFGMGGLTGSLNKGLRGAAKGAEKIVEAGEDALAAAERAAKATGGAARAARYGENWQRVSLKETISTVAGDAPVVTKTVSGKVIYTNPKTGVQVVHDAAGNYFRVENPAAAGSGRYLDQFGKLIPDNVPLVKAGGSTQTGVPKDVRNALTHFNNADP